MVANGVTPVSFTGHVDRSVYKYANEKNKIAKAVVNRDAKEYNIPVSKEKLKDIDETTDMIMAELEQKAKQMHDNIHFAIIHEKCDDCRYLVMYNKKDKSIFKSLDEYAMIPGSKIMKDELFPLSPNYWRLDRLSWKRKKGMGLENLGEAKEGLEILQKYIQDIDVEETEKLAMNKNYPKWVIMGGSKHYKNHFPYCVPREGTWE